MSKLWYVLSSFADAGLSVFGIRGPYEQPPYQVTRQILPGIEIRHYAASMAVETAMTQGNEGEAFGRLFRYITGANAPKKMMAMTAPVVEQPVMAAATNPVVFAGADRTMRFFLPQTVVLAGVPKPADPAVHVVAVPAMDVAVIRFTGVASTTARARETGLLRKAMAQAGVPAGGPPIYLSYDPPFTIPFLRRNEVALPADGPAGAGPGGQLPSG